MNATHRKRCLAEFAASHVMTRFDSGPAVYFLMDKDQIVYIGCTGELKKRIGQHTGKKSIRFDSVRFISGYNTRRERRLIAWFGPKYNLQHNHRQSMLTLEYQLWKLGAKMPYPKTAVARVKLIETLSTEGVTP